MANADTPVLTKTSTYFKTHLPHLHEPEEYYKRALKSTRKVTTDKSMKPSKRRIRKYAKTNINALMSGLTIPLTKLLNAYRGIFDSVGKFEVQLLSKLNLTGFICSTIRPLLSS